MGDDINWHSELQLKKGIIPEEVKAAFKIACGKAKEKYKNSPNFPDIWGDDNGIDYYEEQIEIESGGYVFLDNGYGRYHESAWYEVATFLAPYVQAGTIVFEGVDSDKWRFLFDGKGKWTEQSGTCIYDYRPFETFMEHFDEDMPKELKDKLRLWHKGLKVLNKI